MSDFDKVYQHALKKANSMGSKYTQLLEFERKEIEKQGAEQYWVDLFKSRKKFSTNKNKLLLPFLLKITSVDPALDDNISQRLDGILDINNDPGAFKDKDMPDIDLDFIPDAKDDIGEYAAEQYGSDKVCSVGLWQTYKPRSSLKDVAKSLGYKDKMAEIEKMTKELPNEFDDANLEEAISDYQDFKEWYEKDSDNKKISTYAFRLVGKIKTQGKHAGGLIIASVPLERYLPIAKIGKKGKEKWTSEWTEGKNVQLSKFGFVKYDVLGLKTMQYVYEASKMVEKNHKIKIDWDEIGYEDVESFKTANELKTDSIFQFDTDVAKSILSKGGVKKLTDILVYTSLGRPGPMPMVDEYILRRDSEDPNTENEDAKNYSWREKEHPEVLALLGETLGITVFQEQVSSLLTELAGFTLPEAEKARKIMSKKWKDKMVWVREKILRGFQRALDGKPCPLKRPKIDESDEEKVQATKEVNEICGNTKWTWSKEYWKRLETFARYSFNKCLDANTILENPNTGEQTTIEELYLNKREYKLLSFDNNLFVDEVVNIHFNGYQDIYEVEFTSGQKQRVTLGHKFLNEHGEMETVKELLKSNHALKYITECMIGDYNVEKIDGRKRKDHSETLCREFNLQRDIDIYRDETITQHNKQSNKEIWCEKKIQNKSQKHSQSLLFQQHRSRKQGILVRVINGRRVCSRRQEICESRSPKERLSNSKSICYRYGINQETSNQRVVDKTSSEQQHDSFGFKETRRETEKIWNGNNARYQVQESFSEGDNRWGWIYNSEWERISDDRYDIGGEINKRSKKYNFKRMRNKDTKNSKTFTDGDDVHNHLVRSETMQKDSKLFISGRKVDTEEKKCGKCNIKSIKYIGIRRTYSPEMKSNCHNYITTVNSGNLIQANSHAVSYSIQCYRCLYLKTHYPAEWWSAVLNTCDRKKQPKYIQIAKSEGTDFGSLDINKLSIKFDVVDGGIVPGLLGIKGIGEKMTDKINVNLGDITSIDDFVNRQINNKIFMERVILLGAFDKIHKNRKATWYWYLYKFGTTADAREVRERFNAKFEYTPEQVEEIREKMYLEHKAKHPKSRKVPKRILNYNPKPNPTKKQIMDYVSKDGDYSYEDRLAFQKEFLDYHWDSPMEIYGCKGGHTIENAKENGILECVVSTSESRRTGGGTKFLTLTITDGDDFSRIQIWSGTIEEYGEEFFSPGTGLNIRVSFNEKYKSFNLKKDYPITKLPKKEDLKKIEEYIENTEVFPNLAEVEEDFLGEFE